jgi:hypothetical protein
MRNFSKALLGAAAIHGIYFVATLAVGYVKTINYKPAWDAAWSNVEYLQSEAAFGYAPSPFLYVGTFLGTVLACRLFLTMYDKFFSTSLHSNQNH